MWADEIVKQKVMFHTFGIYLVGEGTCWPNAVKAPAFLLGCSGQTVSSNNGGCIREYIHPVISNFERYFNAKLQSLKLVPAKSQVMMQLGGISITVTGKEPVQ